MTAQLTDAPGARAQAASLRLRAVRDRLRRLQDGEASTADDVRRARRRAEAQVRAVDEARRRLMHADRRAIARQIERRQMAATFAGPERAASEQATRTDAQLARLEDGITSLLVWRGGDQSSDPDRRHAWAGRVVDRIAKGTKHDWLGAVCLAAASHLPIRGAAIAVRSRSTVDFTAASDRWAADAQDLELVLGEGPATTAHAECRVVDVADVADVADLSQPDSTWIAYAAAAASHGVSAVRAVPLLFQGVGLGTLTLFCEHPNEPTGQLSDEIAALAEVASVALLADVEGVRLGASTFVQPVSVAAGLLAARLDIPFDDAMTRLRAHAFGTGRALTDVAQALLDSGWQDPQSGLADF